MTDHETGVGFLLEKLGGCGRFQVILVAVLFVVEMPASFSMVLMSFGNYNPGWKCKDDNNVSLANSTPSSWENDCDVFEACQTSVQFNPEVTTVVSEWGLVCDRAWISSFIISLQMFGILVGSYITGYMGDILGRKRTFCLSLLMMSIFNFTSYFSNSWQMFAAMRFLIGLFYQCVVVFPFLLTTEFSTCKWRSIIASLPTYGVGSLIFSLCVLFTKDWRQVNLITAIFTGAVVLPSLWTPESLRWLSLKGRKKDVISVTDTIARINQKQPLDPIDLDIVWNKNHDTSKESSRKYSWRHLWRGPALKRTLIFTFLWFSISLMYFVLNFGIKSLTGNFYTNLMVFYALEIPVFLLSGYTPNWFGRKYSTFGHFAFATVGLFIVLGLELLSPPGARESGILVLVMLIKTAISGAWYILQTFMSELYPTVIRSTSLGYAGVMARIGGITAPYLIPNDPDTHFISYTIMGVLSLICSMILLLLPETKGIQLMDTWDVTISASDNTSQNEDENRLSRMDSARQQDETEGV